MKSKIIKLALIPAVIIGIAAQLFFSQTTATVPVTVAKEPISAGEIVREEMLTIIQIPKTALPANAVQDPKEIVGKRITVSRLQNDIIFTDLFKEEQKVLGPDEVLMSVPVHDSIAGFVKEGGKVTIVGLPVAGTPLKTFEKVPVHAVVRIDEAGGRKIYAVVKLKNAQAQDLAQYMPQNAVQVTIAE